MKVFPLTNYRVYLALSFVLLLIILGWWWFFPRTATESFDLIPAKADIVVSFEPAAFDKSYVVTVIPLESVRSQLKVSFNQLDAGLQANIRGLIWSAPRDLSAETVIFSLQQTIPRKQLNQLKDKLVKMTAPVSGQPWKSFYSEDNVFIISTDQSYKQADRSTWISRADYQPGLMLAWRGPLPAKFLQVLSDETTKKIIESSTERSIIRWHATANGFNRLSWSVRASEQKDVSAIPLFFPRQFDLYLLADKESLASTSADSVLGSWQDMISTDLAQRFNYKLNQFRQTLSPTMVFVAHEGQWLVQAPLPTLTTLAETMGNYLQPQLRLGRLPDGSSYRELIRSQPKAQELKLNDYTVRYWGEVQENRLYLLEYEKQSLLTNDLDFLSGDVQQLRQPRVPSELETCIQPDAGSITGLFWLKNAKKELPQTQLLDIKGDFQQFIMTRLVRDQQQEYIFCLL